ncbi:MAG: decaprenyl-phosphate phosphoribosyltransferase [Alphaproteobacteria bacterium]
MPKPPPNPPLLPALLRLMRPHQWVKNGFVLAPAFFSGQLGLPHVWMHSLLAVFTFCLLSSAIYVLNDWHDAPQDRLHPKKKLRPLAAGHVPPTQAALLLLALLVAVAGLGVLLDLPPLGWGLLATYALVNVAYSFYLKQVPVLEWFVLSSGFVLRLMFGAAVLGVVLSPWIQLCTWLVAMMLVVGKRRGDLAADEKTAAAKRPVLQHYTVFYLDAVNLILATATFTCFTLFCVSDYAVSRFGEPVLLAAPLVLFGLLDYLRLVHVLGKGDDPTELVLKERSLQLCLLLFALLFGGLLYG